MEVTSLCSATCSRSSLRSDGDGGTLLRQLAWRAVATWLRPGELHSSTHPHEYHVTLCATLIRSAYVSRGVAGGRCPSSSSTCLRLRPSTRATFQPKIGVELGHRPEAVMYPRLRQSGLRADP